MDARNKIPLRQYYRKIEEKLLNQKSEEALADSHYLLQKYPRNLAVYQVLGKIFLEKQAFDAANSVFEFVLKINPDDFVAHLGLSLIAENFGNLEAALKNMQRAYEIQPANENLQNEVKRLMKEKDGFAPEKLRLSRGSLIKMYKRSQLTEQGIAEAKLGIQENPDRIDFKTELADMLAAEGRTAEAIETALEVIKKLPYCLPALKTLNSTLASNDDRTGETNIRARLIEIDPYYAFMKSDTKDVENIPDIAIMVEESSSASVNGAEILDLIKTAWETEDQTHVSDDTAINPNWEKIVDEAVINDGLGEPINEKDFEEVKLPEDFVDDIPDLPTTTETTLSKKELFKLKLAGASISETAPPVPAWLFEDEEKILGIDHGKEEISTPNQPDVFPAEENFDETGVTDLESPVIENAEKHSDNLWKEETAMDNDTPKTKPSLEDTQRVKVLSDDNEELYSQALESFKSENFPFAYQCLDRLLENNHNLPQLAEDLTDISKEFPGEIEISLYLVKIYNSLGNKEKALKTLQIAQKNINFE